MHAMELGQDWARLAARIRQRRGEMRLSQTGLATAAGVSTTTVSLIENAGRTYYQPAKLIGIEAALGWRAGSIEKVLAGGAPDLTENERGHTLRIDLPPGLTDEQVNALRVTIQSLAEAFRN